MWAWILETALQWALPGPSLIKHEGVSSLRRLLRGREDQAGLKMEHRQE